MIPWIRKTYPDIYLLVGSVVDNDAIVGQMQRPLTIAPLWWPAGRLVIPWAQASKPEHPS
jgi:hypothetical protein